MFWSDNGYFQGEHHRADGKILAYNPAERVPIIVTGPGMRTPRNSYVRYSNGAEELYDEWKDPLEMSNVAQNPAYAAVERQLHRGAKDIHHCRGASCRPLLPPALRVGPAAEAARGRAYWDAVCAAYGNRRQ